jgi:biotin synthesis protein BioG
MKSEWLIKSDSRNLILFFAGWGMDPRPFRHLTSDESNVLMFFDYRDGDVALDGICRCSYDSINLIAWSLGVVVAELICSKHQLKPDRSLAINGTPYPAHDEFGIPEKIFDGTCDTLSEKNLQNFYRRMCGTPKNLEQFLAVAPSRSIEDITEELCVLRNLLPPADTIFKKALVSQDDRIVPPANQLKFWNKLGVSTTEITGAHYLFNSLSSPLGGEDQGEGFIRNTTSWEELLNECNEDR